MLSQSPPFEELMRTQKVLSAPNRPCTTTNKASEFCEFIDYLVKLVKMRTGNDVKKLYSDYFSG